MAAPENEIRVITADLDARSPRYDGDLATLTPRERDRAQRIRVEWVRRRFVAARAFLRERLGTEAEVDSTEIQLGEGPQGKPFLVKPALTPGLELNVSHSAGLALLAIARGRAVGIDVEHIRTNVEIDALARRFFSPRERDELLALPLEARLRAFFACWTRKEAYVKARGLGLSLPLDRFDVSFASEDDHALLTDRGDVGAVDRWRLMGLDLKAVLGPTTALSVEAALAVQAQPHELITYRLLPSSP